MSRENIKVNKEVINIDKTEFPDQQEKTVPKPKKATVKCSYNVALRKKPNRNGTPVRAVKDGTIVEVLSRDYHYSQVRVDGIIGYIASEFLI